MPGPGKNRLHGYEVGWFTLLEKMGVASADDLRAAQGRVTRAVIDRIRAQRRIRRSWRDRHE